MRSATPRLRMLTAARPRPRRDAPAAAATRTPRAAAARTLKRSDRHRGRSLDRQRAEELPEGAGRLHREDRRQDQFVSTGDNVSTVVGSKIEGGNAPDVVMVPQVGVLQQFAEEGLAQARCRDDQPRPPAPTTPRCGRTTAPSTAPSTACTSRRPTSRPSGTAPSAFEQAGVTAAQDAATQMLKAGRTVSDSGTRRLLRRAARTAGR